MVDDVARVNFHSFSSALCQISLYERCVRRGHLLVCVMCVRLHNTHKRRCLTKPFEYIGVATAYTNTN